MFTVELYAGIRRAVMVDGISRRGALSSDLKCNTPHRFDIGKVIQDLKECCHANLFASFGGRTRSDRHSAGGSYVGNWVTV